MARPNAAPDLLHWWSPRKIVLQIILLQLAYTITATILMAFLVLVMGDPFQLDLVFLYERYRFDVVFGWSLAFLSIITALLTYRPCCLKVNFWCPVLGINRTKVAINSRFCVDIATFSPTSYDVVQFPFPCRTAVVGNERSRDRYYGFRRCLFLPYTGAKTD